MKKIVLFGTGAYAKKYKTILDYLQLEIAYFVDNDNKKWGQFLYQKEIVNPNKLYQMDDYCILISCTMEDEIKKQLVFMELADYIVTLQELLDMYRKKKNLYTEKTIIIDMFEGYGTGGTEYWAANMALELKQRGKRVILFGGKEQTQMDPKYECLVTRFSMNNTINQMVEIIKNNLPCIFINNFGGTAMFAAAIVKKEMPEYLEIISVVHNDNENVFDSHMEYQDYISKVFCVSERIKKHIQEKKYNFNEKNIYSRPQPIKCSSDWNYFKKKKSVIKIGYAGRLVKAQKRADLLPMFIKKMEQKNINYLLEIAGDGNCLIDIEAFIKQYHLQEKVYVMGQIAKDKMYEFWQRQDVFINISEFEGMSLSMVEAMSYGCVPIVTDVSGTEELILNGKNGYICRIGDLDEIVDKIELLEKNRDLLAKLQIICQETIQMKCNEAEYWDFWEEQMLV